jgi:Mrp family chromosome partitioning ATPase
MPCRAPGALANGNADACVVLVRPRMLLTVRCFLLQRPCDEVSILMSLIEEVMRRSAHERTAAMPGPVMSTSQATSRPPLAPPPLPENFVPVQYRPAPVDPQAMERNRVLLRVPDVGISRAYKILRTRVLHRLAANNWFTLGITGTAAGEGKSLTAVNLALALAQDVNTSVFLVDLDLQRPQLGAYLGHEL